MRTLFHITRHIQWEYAQRTGEYRDDSLLRDGFIHCSTREQVIDVANTLFRGQQGLVLLCIAEKRVLAPIRYEDCYSSGQRFPHIYGPLNLDAVLDVVAFVPQRDGTFRLPQGLGSPSREEDSILRERDDEALA